MNAYEFEDFGDIFQPTLARSKKFHTVVEFYFLNSIFR